MKENFTSGIDEGRQDKLGEACFLLYSDQLREEDGLLQQMPAKSIAWMERHTIHRCAPS
jgi:hypothetical protein